MKKLKGREALDRTPKYTVKEVSHMMKISAHTIRYYDNEGLIPFVSRTESNIRLFSDYTLSWLKIVHYLRTTNLSISDIKKYVYLSLNGNKTIKQRAEIIFAQEKKLKEQLNELQCQIEILRKRKKHYEDLLNNKSTYIWNPYD